MPLLSTIRRVERGVLSVVLLLCTLDSCQVHLWFLFSSELSFFSPLMGVLFSKRMDIIAKYIVWLGPVTLNYTLLAWWKSFYLDWPLRRSSSSVTRVFFWKLEFFSENVGKNCEKGPKFCKKVKIYVIKYNLLNFYY